MGLQENWQEGIKIFDKASAPKHYYPVVTSRWCICYNPKPARHTMVTHYPEPHRNRSVCWILGLVKVQGHLSTISVMQRVHCLKSSYAHLFNPTYSSASAITVLFTVYLVVSYVHFYISIFRIASNFFHYTSYFYIYCLVSKSIKMAYCITQSHTYAHYLYLHRLIIYNGPI